MRTPIYQLDAFTTRRFAGNPAAVMPLHAFPDDSALQAIAAENNLAETAFLVPHGGDYRLRWFTPAVEVPLCGHATLASAAVVLERLEPGRERVTFHTASGPLTIERRGTGFSMDFPARPTTPAVPPPELTTTLGARAVDVASDGHNLLAVLENEGAVRALAPDIAAIARLDYHGLIVTAAGDGPYDFVSRYFAPTLGVPEDPVTGSAHCALAPYWASRSGKTAFVAYQASPRGGEVRCAVVRDRVTLEGMCVFYLEGEAEI